MSDYRKKIAVLGGGAWGTALGAMLARNGHDVSLWARHQQSADEINQTHLNRRYLGEIPLPKSLIASSDLESVCDGSEIVLVVTPAQTVSDITTSLSQLVANTAAIVLCAKGIDRQTLALPHEVAERSLGNRVIAALSGPSFAVDVARGLPTAVTLAAPRMEDAKRLSTALSGDGFRIYASDDRTGVELGGALKNIIAISVGVCRGMGLGASAEAALTTRGFAEINRLATSLGAKRETLLGLSGLGDLLLTCSSEKSRNFSYGLALGSGGDVSGLPLAEGAKSVFMADEIARTKGIECPIISATKRIVEGDLAPRAALDALLNRPLKPEDL